MLLSIFNIAKIAATVSCYNKSKNAHIKKTDINPNKTFEKSVKYKKIFDEIKEQLAKSQLSISNRRCPKCAKPFSIIKVKGTGIDYCQRCNSMWFDANELKYITNLIKDIPADNFKNRKSKFNCPVCNCEMLEYLFQINSNILVDSCANSHGVFLESGELERIIEKIK